MKRGHRRTHRLFWIIVGPLLLVYLFTILPEKNAAKMENQELPPGASVSSLQ